MLLASPPHCCFPTCYQRSPSAASLLEPVDLLSPNDANVSKRSIYGAPVCVIPARVALLRPCGASKEVFAFLGCVHLTDVSLAL